MPLDRKYFTIGRRVQFKDSGRRWCRAWDLKFGRITTVDDINATVVFDEAIHGKFNHLCSLSYLHPIFSPEEEIEVKDQINREQHADKYL